MDEKELRLRKESKRLNKLKITTCEENKPYVFISYKSDDWKEVLEEVVYSLQKKYGLRVYYDRDFENNNDLWITSMQKNMKSKNCIAVLAFYSERYVKSYATLLEILTSQRKDSAVLRRSKEIVPIFLEKPSDLEQYCEKAKYTLKRTFTGIKKTEWDALRNCIDNFKLSSNKITPGQVKIACEEIDGLGDFDSLEVEKVIDCFAEMNDVIAANHNDKFLGETFINSLYETIHSIDRKIFNGVKEELGLEYDSVFDKELICEADLDIPQTGMENCEELVENFDGSKKAEFGTENEIQEKTDFEEMTESETDEMESLEDMEDTNKPKKCFSVTGDIKYTIYGNEYVENQSDMMLRIFAQVLKRHEDKVDMLPKQAGMNCAAKWEDIENPGTKDAKPSYFRVCENFKFSNGTSVCIGTAYGSADKMKKIARLLEICEEERSIFASEQIELPEVKKAKTFGESFVQEKAGNKGISYKINGEEFVGDQTMMMCHICSYAIEKNSDKLDAIVEGTLCVGFDDSSIENVTYFRVNRPFETAGRKYRIGTSFGLPGKIKEIEKVFAICGMDLNLIEIEGQEFSHSSKKTMGRSKKEKNFMDS